MYRAPLKRFGLIEGRFRVDLIIGTIQLLLQIIGPF